MFTAKKIRLKPTPEQEVMFWKCFGVARWTFNFYIEQREQAYQAYKDKGSIGEFLFKGADLRKYINNNLKPTTHKWLSEVGSNVMKQAVKDAEESYIRYFKGISQKPSFKSKHKSKPSFYVNYESLQRVNGGFKGEKLGTVKTTQPLPKLPPTQKHYLKPRITFDGKHWYLSVILKSPEEPTALTGESLGIDLGIKNLAVCSDGKIYKNINRSKRVKQLEKRLKRQQRKLSRMLEANIKEHKVIGKKRYPVWKRPLCECMNIQRQNAVIRNIYKKLANIRNNHIHQATSEIVRTKPSRIVMETLNIKSMMKNRYMAHELIRQKLYEFKRQIEYKCQRYGIEFVQVDRFYPSSKTCSCCGAIKQDLKLSDRNYICPHCGLNIDRDLNASLNLAHYQSA